MCTGAEIMAVASVVQGVGALKQSEDLASQYERRADQILESSKEQMRQGAKGRERARSRLRAGYGKAGVTMTGTAKKLEEEQIRQDEMELLKQKYNAEIAVVEQQGAADEVRRSGLRKAIGYGTQGIGGLAQ